MGRVIAIDFGTKKMGLAHTDENQLIASPLKTVDSSDLFTFLIDYFANETVDSIVVGEPRTLSNKPADINIQIVKFVDKLKTVFNKPIYMIDERFTSKIASQAMLYLNINKMKRRDKNMVDKISASIILQSFLDRKKRNLI
tara:strand:+ start:94 stop:516 length:423 start_codon:yes stop_codon:yes gene_type:complete